jgi:hypothetical protein
LKAIAQLTIAPGTAHGVHAMNKAAGIIGIMQPAAGIVIAHGKHHQIWETGDGVKKEHAGTMTTLMVILA